MSKFLKKIMVLMMVGSLCLSQAVLPVYADSIAMEEPMNTVDTVLKKKAKAIVKAQTKTSDSKKTKLKKLFKYVEKTYGYQRVMNFSNTKGWEKTYAKEMYANKKGNCYHFAAAYAYLAKAATGYPVKICIGKTNGFSGKWQGHAWTEIKINGKWYIFDTNLDKFAAKSSLKYYRKSSTSSAMKKVFRRTTRVMVKF